MKDFARRILGENACSWTFFAREFALGVVVFDFSAGSFFRRERHMIVEIKVAAE